MSRFMHSRFSALSPYTPGEQPKERTYVKLNTNESPYPPSPAVQKVVHAGAAADLRLYSDPALTSLKQAVAAHFGTGPENVFAGNGSDECLYLAFMAFGEQGVAFPDITYGFYPVYASLFQLDARIIPVRRDLSVDLSAYHGIGKTIVIANPNAPTGLALPVHELEQLVATNAGNVVVIDEAYVDFGAESAARLTTKYDNLLVIQTFSKSRSLAGARVGFAIGNSSLIRDLETLKYSLNPYNVNRLSEACAVEAMRDEEYFQTTRQRIMETRKYTASQLRARGFSFPDSKTNFLFVKKEGIGGKQLYLALKEKGVLVRHFENERIRDYNRITIGTREDMDTLLAALDDIITGKEPI